MRSGTDAQTNVRFRPTKKKKTCVSRSESGRVAHDVGGLEYHLISAKDLSRLHQFVPQILPGIFFGDVFEAGGIWKGDILVADIEELELMDASELHARMLNAKEVLTPMKVKTSYSQSQMEQSNSLEEIRF